MNELNLLENYECVAYHGTKKENVSSILKDGFNISDEDDEYLGTGIYFYEKDIFQAIYWRTKAKKDKITNVGVIKANIKSDKLIDLTLTSHYEYVYDLSEKIRKRAKNALSKKGFKPSKLTPKNIFNTLYRLKEFDVIKHVFKVPHGGKIIGTEVFRSQIQLCIRNRKAIHNLEEVDLNGYEELP